MALDLNALRRAPEPDPIPPDRTTALLLPGRMLRWAYMGRMALVFGVLLGALVVWGEARPDQTFLTTVMFLVALLVTGASAWHTELVGARPTRGFLAAHTTFDVLLVTGIVYVTGGADSGFAWLFILAIAQAALFLPLTGAMVVALLAPVLYFTVIALGDPDALTGGVVLQLALFAVVAVLTGVLGDRLRKAGVELGEVRSELRRLRLDTSEILASISTGVLTVDADGRLVYLNPAGEALLGLDVRQWEGAPVEEALRTSAPDLARTVTAALREGRTMHRRRAEIVRDGEELVLGLSIFVREEPEEPRSITVIFQDITDLEQMEILNRRTERLEAVAELSAAMAHEIKNPLASIRSAVEQFASPRLDGDDRASLTRMVVRESDRLSRLLSDFLDFSRVRLDRVERLDVGELVRDCAALVRQSPDVTERGITLELDLPEEPLEMVGDGDLLHRTLVNLTLNAVQFTPEGRTVVLGVDDLTEAGAPRGIELDRPVRIRIRDRGPGIPAAELDRIFDPFYTTREGGSGLGLAVVYRTVQAHRGVILVEAPEGGGAEFQVYLPESGPQPRPPTPPLPDPNVSAGAAAPNVSAGAAAPAVPAAPDTTPDPTGDPHAG